MYHLLLVLAPLLPPHVLNHQAALIHQHHHFLQAIQVVAAFHYFQVVHAPNPVQFLHLLKAVFLVLIQVHLQNQRALPLVAQKYQVLPVPPIIVCSISAGGNGSVQQQLQQLLLLLQLQQQQLLLLQLLLPQQQPLLLQPLPQLQQPQLQQPQQQQQLLLQPLQLLLPLPLLQQHQWVKLFHHLPLDFFTIQHHIKSTMKNMKHYQN